MRNVNDDLFIIENQLFFIFRKLYILFYSLLYKKLKATLQMIIIMMGEY